MSGAAAMLDGDAIHLAVALTLLGLSISSWTLMLGKIVWIWGVGAGVRRGIAVFWQASDWEAGARAANSFDHSGLLGPLAAAGSAPLAGTLAATGRPEQQHMRSLRAALDAATRRLQFGQVVLATVGATAPFVGLLGTVWGIYHALLGIAEATQVSLPQIAAPVGQALIMTAAGLAVAIPAVLGYNLLGRWIARIESQLEGFAFDLHALRHAPAAD
jgi:biopolymer transport protein ExbB